jgi:hypothetical protein
VTATDPRYRLYDPGSPAQTDVELADELLKRDEPWTAEQYERVRQAAIKLCYTHITIDRKGERPLSGFDGRAYWDLLGALDRTLH